MRSDSIRRVWALVQGMPQDAVTWISQAEKRKANVISVAQFREMLEQ